MSVSSARNFRRSDSYDGRNFTPDCQLWLSFDTPRSLDEISGRWVHWVTHLLSLLIGTSVRCEEITVSELDRSTLGDSLEEGANWFSSQAAILGRTGTKHRRRLKNPTPYDMLAPFSSLSGDFGKVIRRWHEMSDRFDAVINLFSAVVLHHSLYSSAQFLFLIQALEVYHVRSPLFQSTQISPEDHRKKVQAVVNALPPDLKEWVERKIQASNYKYLNERVLEIFRAYENEAKKLFGDVEKLAGRIAYTRNHFTHFNKNTDSEHFLNQIELASINFHLESFLWVVLLREIGAPEAAVEKILHRSSTVISVNLGQTDRPSA